jgi:hypothetical protein
MSNPSSFSYDLLKLVRRHLSNGGYSENICEALITVGYVSTIERFGLNIARGNTNELLDSIDKINKPIKGARWTKNT